MDRRPVRRGHAFVAARLLSAGAAFVLVVTAVGPAGSARADSATDAGTLQSLTPARILDTDTGRGAPAGAVASRGTVSLQVTGRGGVPTSGVSAVVLDISAERATVAGAVRVWPAGAARPSYGALRFAGGANVANLVIVQVGDGGKVNLYNASAGTVELAADVTGYYLSGTPSVPGALQPLPLSRILDTSSGTGAPAAAVAPHGSLSVQVTGRGGVRASGVSAVLLTVTAAQATARGAVRVGPPGETPPFFTALHFPADSVVSTLVVAQVGTDGEVELDNASAGTVQLAADVSGYYLAGTPTALGALQSMRPARLLNTRTGVGSRSGAVAQRGRLSVQVLGRAGVPASGVSAVLLSITATQAAAPGEVRVWPAGARRPSHGALQFGTGPGVSSLVQAQVGSDGKIDLFNASSGTVQLHADVTGYVLAPAGIPDGRFAFTFDSPTEPWTSSELDTLHSWTAPDSPELAAVYAVAGHPVQDLSLNVTKASNTGHAGEYGGDEVSMSTLALNVFLHELDHAVHDRWIITNTVWEEGMARAAEDEELHLLARQHITWPNTDPNHDYTYDRYYDLLNVPDVGPENGQIYGSGAPSLVLLRYEQGGYAFGKVLIEHSSFLKDFNAGLFQQQPGTPLPTSTLVDLAAAAAPSVEGQPFAAWYAGQHIFDETPPTGCRMYQRINQFTADFFCRDGGGQEIPQAGAVVTMTIYDDAGAVLYSDSDTTTSYGWASFWAGLGTYDGRIRVVASGTSPTGTASSTYFRQSGPENGVFGVITNQSSGSVTLSSTSGEFTPITVPVSNGAFSAPSLTSVRGTILAVYSGDGTTATKTFTKADSPYAVEMTAG